MLNKSPRVAVKQVAPSMTSIIGQKGSPQTAKAVIVPSGPNGLVNGGNIVLNNNQTVIRKEPIIQQHPRVTQASVIRAPSTTQSGEVYATATPRYVIPTSQHAAGTNAQVFQRQQIVYYSPYASSISRESNNNTPLTQQKNGYYVMAPSLQAVPTSAATAASTPPSVDGASTLDLIGTKRQKPTIISTPPNRHIQVNPRSLNYIQPPTKIPKIDSEVNIKVTSTESSNHVISSSASNNKPSLNFAHHVSGSSKTVTTAGTFKLGSSEPSIAIQTTQKPITPALLPTAIRPAGTSSIFSPPNILLSERNTSLSVNSNKELVTGLTTATVAIPKQALAPAQPRKKGRERKQLLPQPAPPARDDVSTDEADENQDEPHHLESRHPDARIKLEQEVYSERLNPEVSSSSGRWRRPRLTSTSQNKQPSYRHFLRLSTSEVNPSHSRFAPSSTAPSTPSEVKNLGRSTLKRLHQVEASLGDAQKEETEVSKRFDSIIQKERDIPPPSIIFCTVYLSIYLVTETDEIQYLPARLVKSKFR